jgi:hypothetical protein
MCFVSSLEFPNALEMCKQLSLVSINPETGTSSTANELAVDIAGVKVMVDI